MSDVIIRDKAEYHTRTTDEMERHLSPPPWSLRQKMALADRILRGEKPNELPVQAPAKFQLVSAVAAVWTGPSSRMVAH